MGKILNGHGVRYIWNTKKSVKYAEKLKEILYINEFVQTIKITSEEWEKHFADFYIYIYNRDGNEGTNNKCAEEPATTPRKYKEQSKN